MAKKNLVKISIIFVLFSVLGLLIYYYYPQNKSVNHSEKKITLDKIKFINEKNSKIIKLNNRVSNLPFHPIKLKILAQKLFYIDSGKLYFIFFTIIFYCWV